MALIGFFNNLAEAQKLVQSVLLAGIVQEVYEQGQLLKRLPVATINSKTIDYYREKTLPSAAQYGIGDPIPWSADVEYSEKISAALTITARQDPLDNFMMKTYGNPNNYRALITKQLSKGCMRTIEDLIIYGDATGDNPTGLDKLCPAVAGHTFATGYQDHDAGGSTTPLSLSILLDCVTAVKPKPDFLLMTQTLSNMITSIQWKGIGTQQPIIQITAGVDKFGDRINYFNGIPILVSDYLTTENDDTGGKLGTGALVSVYAIRLGQIMEGGLCLVTGGDTGGVEFFKITDFAALEGYLAGGIRLEAYWNLALGSTKAISRIHSINQTVAVAA